MEVLARRKNYSKFCKSHERQSWKLPSLVFALSVKPMASEMWRIEKERCVLTSPCLGANYFPLATACFIFALETSRETSLERAHCCETP
jgi:hypothetical protein